MVEVVRPHHHGAHSVPGCPYTAYNTPSTSVPYDGCAEASKALSGLPTQFYHPAGLTDGTILQNGQCTGSTRATSSCAGVRQIDWNVPGVDYPVGIRPGAYCNGPYVSLDNPTRPCSPAAGAGNLIDATRYDWLKDNLPGYAQTGCTKDGTKTGPVAWTHPTNPSGGSTVLCSVAPVKNQTINFDGFDLTPDQGCVGVQFSAGGNGNGSSGTLNFRDNRYSWVHPSKATTGGVWQFTPSTCFGAITTTAYSYELNFFGLRGDPQTSFADNWTNNFEYNYFDGNPELSPEQQYWYSLPNLGGYGVAYIIMDAGLGKAKVRYNYFANSFRHYVAQGGSCSGYDVTGNVVRNQASSRGSGQHGDFGLQNPGVCEWGKVGTIVFTAGDPNIKWGATPSQLPVVGEKVNFNCAFSCTVPSNIVVGTDYVVQSVNKAATPPTFTIGVTPADAGTGTCAGGFLSSSCQLVEKSDDKPTIAYQNNEGNLFYFDKSGVDGSNNTAMFTQGENGFQVFPPTVLSIINALNVYQANIMDHYSTGVLGSAAGGTFTLMSGTPSAGDRWVATSLGPKNPNHDPAINYGVDGSGQCEVPPAIQINGVSGAAVKSWNSDFGGRCATDPGSSPITATMTCVDNITTGSPILLPPVKRGACVDPTQTATMTIPKGYWGNGETSTTVTLTNGSVPGCSASGQCYSNIGSIYSRNAIGDVRPANFRSYVVAPLHCMPGYTRSFNEFDILTGKPVPPAISAASGC